MIVDSDGQLLLRFVLAYNVLVKESLDLWRLRKMYVFGRRLVVLIFIDDVLAYPYAFITYEDRGTSDQFTNIILTLIAE
jgi:hypothetical protein